MKTRNMLALLILVGGAAASFYCYTRLAALLPMMATVSATPQMAAELVTLRALMWGFALIAMIAPFGVMKHGS
jgi:hypothetical protein